MDSQGGGYVCFCPVFFVAFVAIVVVHCFVWNIQLTEQHISNLISIVMSLDLVTIL